MSHDEARRVRRRIYHELQATFASAPIRLMSRTVNAMRAEGYPDAATAIGDLDWRTVPEGWPADPQLRADWGRLVESAVQAAPGWLEQLDPRPMGYNLEGNGCAILTAAWTGLWRRQLGLELVNRPRETAQVFVFHGGNQSIQACLQAVAERRRRRRGPGPARVLVPLPTFPCPLDQMALLGHEVVPVTPAEPDLDLRPEDLERIPAADPVDAVYLMPVNNPTGRTLEPGAMQALLETVRQRWPAAAVILDSVYIRLHPRHRELVEPWSAFADDLLIIDSLSKSHGVTGLRSGVVLTQAHDLAETLTRYCQNVQAGPSSAMQAVAAALLGPFATGHAELQSQRLALQQRIGAHLAQRRGALLARVVERWGELLEDHQPALPDPEGYDWEGSMYAVLRLGPKTLELADEMGEPPAVAFYLETGICGVPLAGFCDNPNLHRHDLWQEQDSRLGAFLDDATRQVRLSFGMTSPPVPRS